VPDGGARSLFQQNCVTVEDAHQSVGHSGFDLDSCHVTVRDIADAVCAQKKVKVQALMACLWSLLSMRVLNSGYTLVCFSQHALNTASFQSVLWMLWMLLLHL